ncbi:MAG: hypothetical protein M9894_02610 [Planctomycetes bacterium]|nr:hypothetical protein [Planctomycetota bacterium]
MHGATLEETEPTPSADAPRARRPAPGGPEPRVDRPATSPPAAGVDLRQAFVQVALRERWFLVLLGLGFFTAGAFYQAPAVAMWIGFAFAGYSAVANDSIQTIGTFIASNRHRPWWALWLFVGGLFLLTATAGWLLHGGDVSFGRLQSKGFAEAPTSFAFLQVAAPLFLMVLTRLRMPVSTTFLLLSSFSATSDGVRSVLLKSLSGYVLAIVTAAVVWGALGPWLHRRLSGGAPGRGWVAAQWATSGALWSIWLVQDLANIAVFLPRSLSALQFLAFAGTVFFGLGVLLRLGGDRIQQVVDEKSDVVDVRAATLIDAVYALVLLVFSVASKVPMSTTWVFLGLLAGRELSMALRRANSTGRTGRQALRLVARDVGYAVVGLLVSLALATAVNPSLAASLGL